ncbi:PEGA domain-containing protein [Candidatus Falkowbacteria bacterium]|nr:PEGA domain-containing protein [Candidatus Falkowbacteria bacterium]
MKLKTRRLIMIGFILAFFIIAPILIFYASGYRIDIKREKVIKTGTLMMDGKDIKKANIYINDKLYDEPFTEKIFIYNLLPGDYQVRLEKEGYYPWAKKISIYSNLTTFAKDIILFKKELPLSIIDGQIVALTISPDSQKIVYLIDTDSFWELYQYNPNTKENFFLARFSPGKRSSLDITTSSKKVLVNIDNKYSIYDIENQKSRVDLTEIINFLPKNLKWDLQSDNLLFAYYKNAIYSIDIFGKKNEKIFEIKNYNINPEFYVEGKDIFYIQQENEKNILYKYNQNFYTTKKILELPKSENYQFIKNSNNYLGLIDIDQEKLHLIKKINTDSEINIIGSDPIKEFSAKSAVWDLDGKQLLIYDDFEIYIYNPNSGEENIINRYGQPIKKALWYSNLKYIVLQFENSIQIIDLEISNGTHAITEIIKSAQISDFYSDKEGKNIYFNGIIDKSGGLYKLKLK